VNQLSFETMKEGDDLPQMPFPPISRLQLALYCGGSGDHNPIHVDTDFARLAGIRDVFSPGMLSMALMGRLITSLVPQSRVTAFSARFIDIVWVGDEITATGRVAAMNPDTRSVRLDLRCLNQNGRITVTGQAALSFPAANRCVAGPAAASASSIEPGSAAPR
jgi:acyl dehydratase